MNARILDLGCGAGIPVARRLISLGHLVEGVDASSAQIERACLNVPTADFHVGDMTGIERHPGTYDAVVALYSITHIPRDEHASLFLRIYTWLKPGGLFLASLGARDTPDWTGNWLGTTMFFSHFNAETNLRLLSEAMF